MKAWTVVASALWLSVTLALLSTPGSLQSVADEMDSSAVLSPAVSMLNGSLRVTLESATAVPAASFVTTRSQAISFTRHNLGSADGAEAGDVGDIDGDSDIDVVGTSYGSNSVIWWENNGSQTFTQRTLGSMGRARTSFIADIDSDGEMDILSAGGAGGIAWWENLGNRSFSRHALSGSSTAINSAVAVDLDGDTDVDILAAFETPIGVYWFENDGNQGFAQHLVTSQMPYAAWATATDVDADGDLDILATGGNELAWWENDGSQRFAKHSVDTSLASSMHVEAADMDDDGDLDLVATCYSNKALFWWENNGSSVFSRHTISNSVDGAFWVNAFDIDSDGDKDILAVAQVAGDVLWWENDGNQNFAQHMIDGAAVGTVFATSEDIDADGDLDVVASAFDGDFFAWYESSGLITPPPPPSNVQATDCTYADKVQVTWSSSSGATYYEVYRADSSGGTKSKLGSLMGTSYDDTTAVVGTTYYYWAKACNTYGCSDYSAYDTGQRCATTATIQGRVVDASTGDNLSESVVAIGSYWTITNLAGGFSLSVPHGDYQMSASHTGYVTLVQPLSVYGNTSVLLELVPECASGPLEIGGWIPHFDYDNDVDDRPGYPANPNAWDGSKSFTSNACRFEMINPVWYFLSETTPGDIIAADDPSFSDSNTEVDDTMLLDAAIAAGVRVVPVIKTHTDSGAPVVDMLDGHGQEHAQALADLVTEHRYDGIEIDYEGLTIAHRSSFSQFVSDLYTRMPEGKILVVTIPAQTDDYAYSAYDYEYLGQHTDLLKIMAYDDQGQSPITTYPQHHSTLGWVEDVIDYAIGSGGVPAGKLILGLPLYGYRWGQEIGDDHWYKVGSATYEYASALTEDEGITPTRTDVSTGAIPYFTYTSGTTTYLQYYEDAISTARKLELASRKGLRGVGFWRLGREDRGTWPIISALNAQPSDSTVIAVESGTISSGEWNIIQWLVDRISRLVITLSWDQGIASSVVGVSETSRSANSNCVMMVEVYRPAGILFGTFEVTGPTAIMIKGAEPGAWESRVSTTCAAEQNYAIAVSERASTIYLPIALKSH